VGNLLDHDPFLLLADYWTYIECPEVSAAYSDQQRWIRMSVLNIARMGKFSSDRFIREYCDNIWKVKTLKKVWLPTREAIDSVCGICTVV
jgi:starch phosphorylase